MGNEISTTYLEETPPWDDYVNQEWRSERCRELDRLGGLNRPPIARGQSFSAKLQFLAEQVKKQGDVMQEMLLPAAAPKEEAKYTGFMLATERRAFERLLLEQEKAAQMARLAAIEGAEAAAAAAAAAGVGTKPGHVYDRGGPMPKPPPTAAGGSRSRRPLAGSGIHPAVSANGLPIASWRIRMWHARRRVMIIVLTVLRLRRGKTRRRGGNKLDNLGFMINRALADDVGRFVEEQRKYTLIKEELDGAKLTLDEMLCRNGSTGQLAATGALTEETSWPNSNGSGASLSRQVSMARMPSLPGTSSANGNANPTRAAALSVGRLNSRSRGSDSGVIAAAAAAVALHNAGVSPMRSPHGASSLGTASAPNSAPQALGVSGNGPARLSASGLMLRLGMAFGGGGGGNASSGEETQLGPPSPLNTGSSPRSSLGAGLGGLPQQAGGGGGGHLLPTGGSLSSGTSGGMNGANGTNGGNGNGKLRRTSTPGGLGSPGQKDSPPASREGSMTLQPLPGPPPAATLLPSSPSGRRSVVVLPPTPTSVTAQLAGSTAAAAVTGGLSSMAARRFNNRPGPTPGPPGTPGHPTGLVTTNAQGPLTARVTVTSAVAAKHGQIMQVQAQIDAESANLKKSGQMLSMYINRANAAWAEAQAWGSVDAAAVGEVEAFCYSEQYRIYQADLVRRLRQGSICLQVFAGDDSLSGTEKRQGGQGLLQGPTPPDAAAAANGGKNHGAGGGANGHGHANGRSRQLAHLDSGGSYGSSVGSTSLGTSAAASLLLRRRQHHDLWTSDPWELIDRFRPGIMPQTDRIQGPSLGARILCQLVLAVEQLAGSEAKAVMPVLLHINEEQMEEVVQMLWSYRFFGLKRENVILVASPLHSGYRYNHEMKVFEKEYTSSVAPLGSGYSLLQLTWSGEAFVVGPEGAPEVLDTPALTLLQERKVEWLVARRARDLALLSREAILDVPMLAYCMALKDRTIVGPGTAGAGGGGGGTSSNNRANILLEVSYAESLVDARALDSFVMQRVGFAASTGSDGHYGPTGGGRSSLPPLTPPSPSGAGGGATSPSGGDRSSAQGYGFGSIVQHHAVPDLPSAVIELRLGELATPKMIENLNYLRGVRDGQVPVGLGRYMIHVPSLPSLLPGASALRPKLSLQEELVRVSLDLGDITAAPKARTLAVTAHNNPGVLLSADDLEKVIPLLQAQDHDLAFRDMLVANRSESQGLNFVASQASADKAGGQAVVVFVVNNRVSAAAVDAAGMLARPGRDRIHLVTCVSNTLQKTDAEELLKAFQKRLLKSMVDTQIEVLVRGMWGLLDVMENYVAAVDAQMVVMGSQHLTSNDFNYVIGSITLSILKRIHVPMLVVTANSRQNLNIGAGWVPPGTAGHRPSTGADRISASGGGPPGTPTGGAGPGGPGGGGPGGPPPGPPGGGKVSGALRCLSLVENHARNMLAFLCTRLLDTKRGDRLLLAQVQATRHLTRQQAASVRRALDNFNLMASGHGFSVNRVLSLEGPLDEVLSEAVGLQHIQVLAVALPQGAKTIPPVLVNLIRSCRGATIVYKEPIGAKQQQVPRAGFGPGSKAAAAAAASGLH